MISYIFGIVFRVLKWAIILAIGIEVLSFVAISISNYILYGHIREGSRAVYDPYTLFLQERGRRPTEFNSVSRDKSLNRTVWLFGGSTVRGATPHDAATIPSFLAEYLNAEGRPLHFQVVNFGVNSFNSLMETKYLQKALIEAERPPDLIVFYDGANDAKYFAEHRTGEGHHGYRRVKSLIESYHRSWFGVLKPLNAAIQASFTKEIYDKFHQVALSIDENSPALKEMGRQILNRYKHVDKVAQCFGAGFLVVWQPMLWVEDCEVPKKLKQEESAFILNEERFDVMRKNFTTPYEKFAGKLENKPFFVNFRNALCERKVPVYKPDGVHLTDAGREMVAQRLGSLILERFFDDESDKPSPASDNKRSPGEHSPH